MSKVNEGSAPNFDPGKLAIAPSVAGSTTKMARKAVRSTGWFVKAPAPWIYRAMLALGCRQAIPVLRACFEMRHGDKSVRLTAAAMRECGVSTDTRRRALEALEMAGLAKIDWKERAGPIVTWLEAAPPKLPTQLVHGLVQLAASTTKRMCRPAEVLASLARPTNCEGQWPRTTRELLRMLRQADPRYVVVRRGKLWVVLDPSCKGGARSCETVVCEVA